MRDRRELASISAASAPLPSRVFILATQVADSRASGAVRLFLEELAVQRRDARPVLVAGHQRGGGVQGVLDHVIGAVRPNGVPIGLDRKSLELREFIRLVGGFFLIGVRQQAVHRACGGVVRMLSQEGGEVLDDLVRLVHVLVVEVDEREAVAHVAGVAAVRELGEVFLDGGEGLLVLVREEIRHRHIVEGVFDQRAVREFLEELGENRRGFLEVAVLENGESLEEGVAVEALGLGELGLKAAVEAADFGPVSALNEHLAGEGGDLLDIFRVGIFPQVGVAEDFDFRDVLKLVQDDDFGVGRGLGVGRGGVFVADRAEADERLLMPVEIVEATPAAHDQGRVQIGLFLDGGQGFLGKLDGGLEVADQFGGGGALAERLVFFQLPRGFRGFSGPCAGDSSAVF